MSDAPNKNNRTVMMLLGVVVVLLAALVIVVVTRQPAGQVATADTSGTSTTQQASTPATSQQGMQSSTAAAFDPKTATKVPAGKAPKDFAAAYYQAILDKKWDAAFKMQPATSQQGADVAGFQSTQTMYGMKSFKVVSGTDDGSTATVIIQQDLGTNGIWGATWTFVKDGGSWLVKSRAVAMGAPVVK